MRDIRKLIGLKIKSYRKQKSLSQDTFCSIINLEQKNLSRIENGLALPDTQTLCSLIENTDMEPNYLLGFLNKKGNNYSSIDFEIMELLIKLPEDTKKHLKSFLESYKK